jgi:hypothetical protein
MSLPTTPTFMTSYVTGWEEARVHPALAWLEKLTKTFDTRESWSHHWSEWHTDDYTFIAPDGTVTTGGEPAVIATQDDYRVFTAFIHEPVWASAYQAGDDGAWHVVAEAAVFANLPGESREKKFKDRDGKMWDVKVGGMFRFEYVGVEGAVHDGLKMRKLTCFCDTAPIAVEMLKRGLMKPEDLMK